MDKEPPVLLSLLVDFHKIAPRRLQSVSGADIVYVDSDQGGAEMSLTVHSASLRFFRGPNATKAGR